MMGREAMSVLWLSLLASPLFGQTAGVQSFQGLIKDNMGNPVNGNVNLEFRIFDAETLGNLVDMDGDGVVEDVVGQDVTQVLGVSALNGVLSTKFGPVAASAFDGTARWLEVRVGGTPLSRVEMATAPATAEQINIPASGIPVIEVEATTGKVGIGGPPDPLKPELLQVASIRTSTISANSPLVFKTSTGQAMATFGNTGKLAIGATAPDPLKPEMLQVASIRTSTIASNSPLEFRSGTGQTTMTIADDGKVAIGATAPDPLGAAFQVTGKVKASGDIQAAGVLQSGNSIVIDGTGANTISSTSGDLSLLAASGNVNAMGTLTIASTVASGSGASGASQAIANSIVLDASSNSLATSSTGSNLEFFVGGNCVLGLAPVTTDINGAVASNFKAGHPLNTITAGIVGATIGGGGAAPSVAALLGGQAAGRRIIQGETTALLDNSNRVLQSFGTIGGGIANESGLGGFVGGGDGNSAMGNDAVCSGGKLNVASGDSATVAGGNGNASRGKMCAIGGGFGNSSEIAATIASAIPGGFENIATGSYSFAAGARAAVRNGDDGTFMWADAVNMPAGDPFPPNPAPTQRTLTSTGPNQFIVRANGGFWFGTQGTIVSATREDAIIPVGQFIHTTTGAFLTTGGTWTNASDRDAKENIRPVDPADVLNRVSSIPIARWSYKNEPDSIDHIGPMAQDFHAAFGLGSSEKSIATIDADGVALAAIQALHKMLKDKDARITALEVRLAALEDIVRKSDPSARTSAFGVATPALAMIGLLGLLAIGRTRRGVAR